MKANNVQLQLESFENDPENEKSQTTIKSIQ